VLNLVDKASVSCYRYKHACVKFMYSLCPVRKLGMVEWAVKRKISKVIVENKLYSHNSFAT